MSREIKHEESGEKGRFEMQEGDQVVGELIYELSPEGVMSLTGTYVPKEYEGQGIARELFVATVEFAKNEGRKVIPICPYTVVMFNRMPEYQELLLKR